ncbi:MAG TPA: sulfatase/phosphatase domain-containing protein, partial [Thermoanaerobaculia bacterium]|nr:sulfatase/phosphatase domain-containing protein [Thermoanaerobaculia bacterium]
GRGMIEHGHTMYEELLHVPFVWKLPASWGRARGRVDDTLIETRSLLPTLFDLVGQPPAEQTSAPSLVPWLLGRPPAEKPYESVAAEANGMFSVRDERWKAILTLETNSWQLYDLEADPGETRDLAGENPEQLAAMQRIFRRWRNGLHPILSGATAVDQETVDSLRALGYLN